MARKTPSPKLSQPIDNGTPLPEAGVRFLCREEVRALAVRMQPLASDPLRLASKLAGLLNQEERRWFMDYLQLLPRVSAKLGLDGLVCDRLALEQSTARDLGEWKAGLWPGDSSLHDLCCGMGGDSFFVPTSVSAQGFDLDPARIAMYNFNMNSAHLPRTAVLADVRTTDNGADFFCIDPARRAELGQNQRNLVHLTPTLSEVLALARRYGGGMVKLPPGYPTDELPDNSEAIFLGGRSDCRECLLLLGRLVTRPGRVRAVSLTEKISCWEGEQCITEQKLPVAPPGRYLFEPRPVLVRSHLFVPVAQQLGLWQIDAAIAYLSGDQLPPPDAGLNAFEVLGHCPLVTSAVQALLRSHDVGRLTLKKRGVEIVPEDEIKRLDPRGSQEATLFYTRIQDQKSAILTKNGYYF